MKEVLANDKKSIRIRKAKTIDLDEIYEIWINGIKQQQEGDTQLQTNKNNSLSKNKLFLQISTQDNNFPFLVCLHNNRIIGWLSLLPFHPTPDALINNSFAIISTYISKEYQGKGVGTFFIQYALRKAKKTAVKYIVGIQLNNNISSKRMSQKSGFKLLGPLPNRNDFPSFDMIICNVGKKQ